MADGEQTKEAAPEPPSLRSGTPNSHPAIDLCTVAPKLGGDRYERQRVLMFNVRVDPSTSSPEVVKVGDRVDSQQVLEQIDAGERARVVMINELAMSRVHMVVAPQEAPTAFFAEDRTQLSVAELTGALEGDNFALYSLACTDWILIPEVSRGPAVWTQQEKKKTVYRNKKKVEVKYMAWDLTSTWSVNVVLYGRSEKGFVRRATLDSSTGSVAGLAAAVAGSTEGDSGLEYHDYVSTWPEPECAVGEGKDGVAGAFGSCAALTPAFSQVFPDGKLRADSDCGNLQDDVKLGQQAMVNVARCSVHRGVGRQTQVAQRDWKRIKEFTVFGGLMHDGERRLVPVGKADSLRRGTYLIALEEQEGRGRREVGFARITRLGAGGEAGSADPSEIKFKDGDGAVGVRMEERSFFGVQFGARPNAIIFPLEFLENDDEGEDGLQSKFAVGGMIDFGLDLTKIIPFYDEFWLRAGLGFLGGDDEGFVQFDAGFEKVTILGGGSSWATGIGVSVLGISKELPNSEQSATGTSSGLYLSQAWEYGFSPAWTARVGAEARVGLGKAELKVENVELPYDNAGALPAVKAFANFAHLW